MREVTALTDPELFWALRGGGGNFAVITAMEFRLLPITEVYAGTLFFPYERAGEVLEAWRRWTATVPGRGHLDRPDDPGAAAARDARLPARASRSRSSRRRSSAPRSGPRSCSLHCASSGRRWTRSRRSSRSTCWPSTWTPRDRCRVSATTRCSPISTPSPWRRSSRRSAPARDPRCSRSSSAISAAHSAGAAEDSGALGALSGEFMTFAVGMLPVPEMEAPLRELVRRGPGGPGGRSTTATATRTSPSIGSTPSRSSASDR